MDFTSSSGIGESEAGSNAYPSSQSDLVETAELKLIRLHEHKDALLAERSRLLDELTKIKPTKSEAVEIDGRILFKLLRYQDKEEDAVKKTVPSVLPSLDIESRRSYLIKTYPDLELDTEGNKIRVKRKEFSAIFKLEINKERVESLTIDVDHFETELRPIVRYSEQNNNVNVALLAMHQFLVLKDLHKSMIHKICDKSKFSLGSGLELIHRDVVVVFQLYWNVPSPFPETILSTNKNQDVLDYLIYQHGIHTGVIKYGQTLT